MGIAGTSIGCTASVMLWRMRRAKGMTQAALASAVGCSVSTVKRAESGDSIVTLDYFVRACGAFGHDPSKVIRTLTKPEIAQI